MDSRDRDRISGALHYWVSTRAAQAQKAALAGRQQGGTRDAVTGGKHLDGFADLLHEEIAATGRTGVTNLGNRQATVAGYYRVSKSWDLLVLEGGVPLLAVEFKSMVGSEGKNLNNRIDEAIGIAEDARQAEAAGILPPGMLRAYIFIMGATSESTSPVGTGTAVGTVHPVFVNASYMQRAAILCARMRSSGLYQLTWMIGVHENSGEWFEPDPEVGWDEFKKGLRAGLA